MAAVRSSMTFSNSTRSIIKCLFIIGEQEIDPDITCHVLMEKNRKHNTRRRGES